MGPRKTGKTTYLRSSFPDSLTFDLLQTDFEAAAYSHGDLTSYANIARDCGVDAKTVKEYYQTLVDTLLGTFIEPWKRRQERQVIGKAPKFYLFDVGVAGALTHRRIAEERGESFGRALEHFVLMEIQPRMQRARAPARRGHGSASLAGVSGTPLGRAHPELARARV